MERIILFTAGFTFLVSLLFQFSPLMGGTRDDNQNRAPQNRPGSCHGEALNPFIQHRPASRGGCGVVAAAGGPVPVAAWWAFRPEKLWINDKVDEPAPFASSLDPPTL